MSLGGPAGEGWRGAEYSAAAEHHRAFDDWFLTRRPPRAWDTVVDLGCGTGEFTAKISALVPDGLVIGVDHDPSMLATARRRAGGDLEFVTSSATNFDRLIPPGTVDLVVSRAMLHWLPVSAYPQVFAAVHRVLRPDGWYHSESAAAGNAPGVIRLLERVARANDLRPPEPFPEPAPVARMLADAGFAIPADGVRAVPQHRRFTRDELAAMLRTTAAISLTRQAPATAHARLADQLAEAVDELRAPDGTYDQTFVRLEILVRKPVP
ncbi:class I SAM-dependent methyltransferase [Nocardia cyriacigeorgica]|uniref:Trans-aconitate 2-methyltransferase n=1 Tax=Nocardia cyriacigeorgica TaxID=135487 RepID=A0A4U8VYQ5_9NOCA|nr:class I SAM-dependent methyltransferase [Nocardia cyriacigeorgica]MBF6101480.1 class I SAM-dependent methyltransferase [Nocardia cyriacigeorgica]MBF6162123.1 class I SAM-dependent methyltransferase [Nocardia cyriacigeorgica]MBF6200815.1 class I SAM-dependent methyltransferase [Nocardia cyriacigeorgica]VFA97124.1 Trans-aconitate 2-methyltransferase [Nocardia cyriacigeorgica]